VVEKKAKAFSWQSGQQIGVNVAVKSESANALRNGMSCELTKCCFYCKLIVYFV